MRNISFFLTTPQFRNRTKTVTRRLGWKNLKEGTVLMAVEKAQGLKKGEKINKLGEINVVSVRREPLSAIKPTDVIKEGFLEMTTRDFIYFFCKSHKNCTPETIVTRIEFKYL